MKNLLSIKRRCYAWSLLLIICLQHIVNFVEWDYIYVVQVEQNMNTVEQLIADKLELEMGMEVYVDVFTHSELESLFKLGYSTPSIFSEELNGSIYYYTIDVAPEDSQKYSYVIKKRPLRQTHDVPRVFNDRLLSDFYIGEPDSFRTYNLSDNQWKIALIHLREDPFIAIPSPPPKFS